MCLENGCIIDDLLIYRLGAEKFMLVVNASNIEKDWNWLTAAHDRYAAEREAAIDPEHDGPRPTGGVGGTRRGLKCLHAHYAWWLAGGDDPAGQWVADRLAAQALAEDEAP